jgi:hypothetical protein
VHPAIGFDEPRVPAVRHRNPEVALTGRNAGVTLVPVNGAATRTCGAPAGGGHAGQVPAGESDHASPLAVAELVDLIDPAELVERGVVAHLASSTEHGHNPRPLTSLSGARRR